MIKIPLNESGLQINQSDKVGIVSHSKNVSFDKKGYIKLAPRMVNLFDDSEDLSNSADTDFDIPVSFGRYDVGSMRIVTTDEPFDIVLSNTQKTIAEDTSSNNPNLTTASHGEWFQGRYHESTATAVNYNTAGTWTANAITGLTSGVRHYLKSFRNRTTLCVSNGNVLKQYDTSYAGTTDLTIPSDFEITGLAYNNNMMGIITRLGGDSSGQNAEAYFFVWDGATTSANAGVAIGAYAGVAVAPYGSSFIILTSAGQILYWTGGGLKELAHFPFYNGDHQWGDLLNFISYGDNMVVEGDVVYINVGFDLDSTGKEGVIYEVGNPSGVWCFDPSVGLYHKYSPSNSRAYFHSIASASVNTSTDLFTTSVTIPATGNPIVMTEECVGGLNPGVVYYIIKVSSTTFRIAETKDKALAGVYVDVTSASANNYFIAYDLKDFGISYFTKAGGINIWESSSHTYRDVISGGRILDTSLSSQPTLCTAVPFLPNRGSITFTKLGLDNIEINIPSIVIKHAPLDTNDELVVKVKNKEYLDIPMASPNLRLNDEFVWTSDNEGYTSTNLSKVKEAFDAGEELEIEFTAGAGAGQCVKITSISESSGVYSLVLDEAVVGAVAELKSYFVIDNWSVAGTVTSSTQTDGVFECPIAKTGKSPKIRIELRGYEVEIEDIFIKNKTQRSLE